MHLLLGILFLFFAFKIKNSKHPVRIAASILSAILILGGILFATSAYLKIFPPSLLPYVISIIAIESVLAFAAVVASWI